MQCNTDRQASLVSQSVARVLGTRPLRYLRRALCGCSVALLSGPGPDIGALIIEERAHEKWQ